MFASTVLSSIYESIVSLFKSNKVAYIESLEYQLNQSKQYTDFLSAENDELKDRVASQLHKIENQDEEIKGLYESLKDYFAECIMTEEDKKSPKIEIEEKVYKELVAERDYLKDDNIELSKDFWQLSRENNTLKKRNEWLNDMLLENSEFTDSAEVTVVA